METKRDHDTEELQKFKHTSSSRKPRYGLIPRLALNAMADRFELGEKKHAGAAWNALSSQVGLDDPDWVIARAEHIIHHATLFIEKYTGKIVDDGDDDGAAIMWGGACLFEALRAQRNQANSTPRPGRKETDHIFRRQCD